MLFSHIVGCQNHLIAATILYLTIIDPLKELTSHLDKYFDSVQDREVTSLVWADKIDATQDYYKILGLEKSATKQEIHKAFRKLAKKYHPDVNKDANAQEDFIKIYKAYETLSDDAKRKEYDNKPSGGGGQNFNSNWQAHFDMNDFFKHFDDHIFKHNQHYDSHFENHQHHHNQAHSSHHAHHSGYMFDNINFNELFNHMDDDEMFSFKHHGHDSHQVNNHYHSHGHGDDGTFGDGASFFGNHIHDTLMSHHHSHGHYDQAANSHSSGYTCQTIRRQVNGMVMTQTSCM